MDFRFLANDLVCCDTVMEPFAREILARLRLRRGADPADPRPDHGLRSPPDPDAERPVAASKRCRWPGGSRKRGRHRLRHATRVARGGRRLAACRSGGGLLADRFRGTPAMIRWCAIAGGTIGCGSRAISSPAGHNKNHDRRPRSGRRPLLRSCRPHRPAGYDQHRHHSRSRTCRAWIIAMSAQPGYLTAFGICSIAGASSRCSPTSNRAGLASNRPICTIPIVSLA